MRRAERTRLVPRRPWRSADSRRRGQANCAELAARPDPGKTRDELWPGLRASPSGKHAVYYLVASYGVDFVRALHERMDPVSHLP